MTLKIYALEEDGKFIEEVRLESDKEESAKAHRSIYHMPETPYTRVKPIKEQEGFDRYYVNGKWEYRKIESEPVEESEVDNG